MDDLIDEIEDVSGQIHQGLKDYKEQAIKLRHENIIKHIDKMAEQFGLTHEDITYDSKWDNKSTNWKKAEETINQLLETFPTTSPVAVSMTELPLTDCVIDSFCS